MERSMHKLYINPTSISFPESLCPSATNRHCTEEKYPLKYWLWLLIFPQTLLSNFGWHFEFRSIFFIFHLKKLQKILWFWVCAAPACNDKSGGEADGRGGGADDQRGRLGRWWSGQLRWIRQDDDDHWMMRNGQRGWTRKIGKVDPIHIHSLIIPLSCRNPCPKKWYCSYRFVVFLSLANSSFEFASSFFPLFFLGIGLLTFRSPHNWTPKFHVLWSFWYLGNWKLFVTRETSCASSLVSCRCFVFRAILVIRVCHDSWNHMWKF